VDFDTDAYLRVDAPDSLGASPSGIAFATSTGDLLEVSCCGAGVFRLRIGSTTSPDYGIVRAQTKSCTITQPQFGMWTLSAGDTAFELTGKPLSFRLLHKGIPVLRSSSDLTLGGEQRLPTIGRLRSGEQWTAAVALSSGEPVYGLGEKYGPLNKRGQLIHSRVEIPSGVNTGLSSMNTPFAWGPGAAGRHGAWGMFVHTPGAVTHGVGHPDWSHRAYVVVVDDEALDLLLFAADAPEGMLDC
jgi:alpha-D-xyloside xylohydrolase